MLQKFISWMFGSDSEDSFSEDFYSSDSDSSSEGDTASNSSNDSISGGSIDEESSIYISTDTSLAIDEEESNISFEYTLNESTTTNLNRSLSDSNVYASSRSNASASFSENSEYDGNNADESSQQSDENEELPNTRYSLRSRGRKRPASDSVNLKIKLMNEKKSEKKARELQIEETRKFLRGADLYCTICCAESPKIINPMFCVYCFKLVGCEACCREWVKPKAKSNIVRRGSTCPLCRHEYSGSISSNLAIVYETEVIN